MNTLNATTAVIVNPLYDGRATAGFRSLKSLPEGTRFCFRHHFRTKELIGMTILWDSYVHSIYIREGDKVVRLQEMLEAGSCEINPHSYDEAMMMLDPFFNGMGDEPSVSEVILDTLIRSNTWTPDKMLELLKAGLEKAI